MSRNQRIALGALAVSVLIHALAAGLLGRAPESAAPQPQSEELVWLDAVESPPPTPAPAAPVVAAPPNAAATPREHDGATRSAPSRRHVRAHARADVAAPSQGAVASAGAEASEGGGDAQPQAGAFVPRKLVLDPSAEAMPVPSDNPRFIGRTIRNDGSADPRAESPAVAAARTKAVIDTWIEDDQALMRAEEGMVDDYFGQMRLSLSRETSKMQAPEEANLWASIQHAIASGWTSYKDSAQSYGSTGNPYVTEAPPPPAPGEERLDREVQLHGETSGAGPEDLKQKARKAQLLREFADGKFGNGLVAIVELRQARDGRLVESTLLASSGNKLFDAHVMKTAPSALDRLPPPPPTGMGIHADGLRSQWEFRGRWTYKTRAQDLTLEKAYLLALVPVSLLTGSWDDMTGDIWVVDPGNPQFTCSVRLLRLY